MAAKSDKSDHGQAEVQEKKDVAEEQGFHGTKVDPRPNEAYSLQSGPDSPPAVEHDRARVDQPTSLAKEEK